jgi:hypothetical protein
MAKFARSTGLRVVRLLASSTSMSPGSDFYISTFFGPFSVSQKSGSTDRTCALNTSRVNVATSQTGTRGILVEMGPGCQGRFWGSSKVKPVQIVSIVQPLRSVQNVQIILRPVPNVTVVPNVQVVITLQFSSNRSRRSSRSTCPTPPQPRRFQSFHASRRFNVPGSMLKDQKLRNWPRFVFF